MNIIVATDDGTNISYAHQGKNNYLLFKLDKKKLDIRSNKISELVKRTEQVGCLMNNTNLNLLFTFDHKKNVFITKNLSSELSKQLRESGVETYITFKKSISEALYQYYLDWFIIDCLYARNPEIKRQVNAG